MADEERKTTRSSDEDLLLEIRDRYKYASEAWEEIRKERQKDMRYICGDPWEAEDRKAAKTPIRCRKRATKRTRWAWRKFSSPKRATNH